MSKHTQELGWRVEWIDGRMFVLDSDGETAVAKVLHLRHDAEVIANIISAAPELLAALEGLLADMHMRAKLEGDIDSDGCVVLNCGNSVLHAARTAIAKAKGGAA